jgi:signal transduction histidine kinase
MSDDPPTNPLQDLTPEAARAILKAQGHLRLLPDLTLGLMHRLNNLMTSVSFTLEAAEEEIPPGSNAREYLAALGESLAEVQRIIRRTCEVNLSLGSEEMAYQNLNSVLRNDHDLFRFVLPKGADLTIETAPEQMVVRASTSALRSVLLPVLSNAGSAAGDECRVVIRCLPADTVDLDSFVPGDIDRTGPMVAITISDHGCGLAPEKLESLFQPFAAAAAGQAGLGLFSAATTARELGGTLAARKNCETGAEFLLLLPRLTE